VTVESLFVPDGEAWVATPFSRGPWDPAALHGGPVSALLARTAAGVAAPGLAPNRITVELLRPVPLGRPLLATGSLVRPGRNVQLVDARLTLADTGVDMAWARVLFMRTTAVRLPTDDPTLGPLLVPERPPPGPDGLARTEPGIEGARPSFHRDAIEVRFVEGGTAGPVTFWCRLLLPVVPGEDATPLERCVALADMGNGLSAVVGFDTHTFINPELTVHLARVPDGPWLAMRSRTLYAPDGTALAESDLFDHDGHLGRAAQSLLVDAR
jgi:acyl-coenzyme A thioesterase PaaI-like protein